MKVFKLFSLGILITSVLMNPTIVVAKTLNEDKERITIQPVESIIDKHELKTESMQQSLNVTEVNDGTEIQKAEFTTINNEEEQSHQKFELETVDYTKGLSESEESNTDITMNNVETRLNKKNAYFLIRSKDGKYSYGKKIYPVHSGDFDKVQYEADGGELGEDAVHNSKKNYFFTLGSDFYAFYDDVSSSYNPYRGKNLNYFLNWVNYWSEEEVSIVLDKDSATMYQYVRNPNTGLNYTIPTIDYTKGLSESEESNTDITMNNVETRLNKKNAYFLIRSKDGKYSYGKKLYPVHSGDFDKVQYEADGGELGEDAVHNSKKNYFFTLGSDFYDFYDDVSSLYNPYRGKNLNYFLNWVNHWSEEEVSIVTTDDIELYAAKQQKLLTPWKFYKTGRTSERDQFYSLLLHEPTRLTYTLTGSSSKTVRIYNKQEQKVWESKSYSGTETLSVDLPAGEYYILVTNRSLKTTFQMTRSTFNESQLSIDTNKERTNIYLNNQFNQELTAIYAPYHNKEKTVTVVDVNNKLVDVWNQNDVSYLILDQLYGKNHLVKASKLSHPSLTNIGNIPIGSQLHKNTVQYIGQDVYYSQRNIFTMKSDNQPKVAVVDDLFYIALLLVIVQYSAYVQNNQNLSLTMPTLPSFDVGSWDSTEDWSYNDSVVYDGKTYGIDDEGDIRDLETGEALPDGIIAEDTLNSGAGLSAEVLIKELAKVDIKTDKDYDWYTFSDLLSDELEGGHTIKKHVMKSNDYLLNRLENDGKIKMSTTYKEVLATLIAINLAKIENSDKFQSVTKKEEYFSELDDEYNYSFGRGYWKMTSNVYISSIGSAVVVIQPSISEKGFRVLTSYPTVMYGSGE